MLGSALSRRGRASLTLASTNISINTLRYVLIWRAAYWEGISGRTSFCISGGGSPFGTGFSRFDTMFFFIWLGAQVLGYNTLQ